MDKKKSILNVSVSIAFRIATVIMSIVVRRLLILFCGNEVNGLNSLYLSIVGFLSVAELGVGSAISFCMYKPIVEGNNKQVSALYHLFRRLYTIIGAIVLTSGLAITPFMKFFAKDFSQINVDLYITFVLILLSTVITYMFGAKTALINAYKNNYITTAISSGGIILQYILQISVLLVGGSFQAYLCCRIVASLAQWIISDRITKRKYDVILTVKEPVDRNTKSELVQKIKAMFMHKIGMLLVNTVDSVIISAFVGVIALGEYTNYTAILSSLVGILKLVFTSLTSVLGHLYVSEKKNKARQYSDSFHVVNFVIGTIFFLGYYAIIDDLIAILFSSDLIVAKSISFVITLNGFIQFMRESTLVFRDATGTFYNDRWKPLIEGTVNIILSILLVNRIGVVGVIVATIITNLLICHIVEPYVLYKNAFSIVPVKYYIRNYGMITLFSGALVFLDMCMRDNANYFQELCVNGFISVGVSLLACAVVLVLNPQICKFLLRRRKAE